MDQNGKIHNSLESCCRGGRFLDVWDSFRVILRKFPLLFSIIFLFGRFGRKLDEGDEGDEGERFWTPKFGTLESNIRLMPEIWLTTRDV